MTTSAKVYLVFSGGIFFLVAIFHFFRLLYHWPIIVGSATIPQALSYLGLPASSAYCGWAFWLLATGRRGPRA
jgi:hypothetical protein